VRAADAIRFATPEYNYSAWQGKPVAVLSASVGVLGSSPTRRRAS
jgi:NAD(P)H-dependent FMN reductase